MRNLFFILILSITVSCITSAKSNIELKKGHVIVEGRVSNLNNNSKVLRFQKLGIDEFDQTAIIDSSGYFRAEFDLFHAQNVDLSYENRTIDLYIKPGDGLYLTFDATIFKQNPFPYFEISGSSSITTNNIQDYAQFHNSVSFEPQFDKSVKEFLNDLNKQLALEDSVLNDYCYKNKPTNEFITWSKKNIKYSIANNLMVYYAISEGTFKQKKPEIFNTDLFPVNDDSAIVSGLYFKHLNNYVFAKYINGDSICQRFIQKKETKNVYTRIFSNLIKHEKPGLGRDIMIYKNFCDFLSYRVNDTLKQDLIYLWASFSPLIKNSELLNLLAEKKSDFERQGSYKEIASNLKSKSKSETLDKFWETVHSKYKGKIIYIDIWATWCGPCRGEISPAIVLHDQFRDKPIAFINLCLLSNKDEWEKLIEKSHLTGDNYFFNEEESNLLRDELKFVNYPTHMIIDKKGNLIEKNAPGPSSGDEIKNMLNNLLEK